jgi:hypothetical protein
LTRTVDPSGLRLVITRRRSQASEINDPSIAQGILPVVYYHLSLAYRHASGKRVRSRTFTLVRPDNPSTDSRYDCHGHIDHHLFAGVSSMIHVTRSQGTTVHNRKGNLPPQTKLILSLFCRSVQPPLLESDDEPGRFPSIAARRRRVNESDLKDAMRYIRVQSYHRTGHTSYLQSGDA